MRRQQKESRKCELKGGKEVTGEKEICVLLSITVCEGERKDGNDTISSCGYNKVTHNEAHTN